MRSRRGIARDLELLRERTVGGHGEGDFIDAVPTDGGVESASESAPADGDRDSGQTAAGVDTDARRGIRRGVDTEHHEGHRCDQ